MIRVVMTASVLLLSGCMLEVLGATAIQSELQAKQLQGMKRQIEHAQGVSAEVSITQAIRVYQAKKGFNPASLEVLVPEYLPSIPAKPDGSPYGYDPQTGALLDHPVQKPNITADDYGTLDKIRAGIYQYGQATKLYPANLGDLVPNYLPQFPMTSDGRMFLYNPQTGEVIHPDQQVTTPAPVPVPAQGGYGSVSQPIQNMNQAGVNAAQSRARSGTDAIAGGYSNRQMQQVEELGF
ncbi:MAG: hypothetical protein GC168_18440 [Candidatus Hydrogenedens sp.]|nr:hypothetical protein [Candidatus Hydrogenedens sp.]